MEYVNFYEMWLYTTDTSVFILNLLYFILLRKTETKFWLLWNQG